MSLWLPVRALPIPVLEAMAMAALPDPVSDTSPVCALDSPVPVPQSLSSEDAPALSRLQFLSSLWRTMLVLLLFLISCQTTASLCLFPSVFLSCQTTASMLLFPNLRR